MHDCLKGNISLSLLVLDTYQRHLLRKKDTSKWAIVTKWMVFYFRTLSGRWPMDKTGTGWSILWIMRNIKISNLGSYQPCSLSLGLVSSNSGNSLIMSVIINKLYFQSNSCWVFSIDIQDIMFKECIYPL